MKRAMEDYSTSCALKLAKAFSMNPREISELLVRDLACHLLIYVAVEVLDLLMSS